MVRVEGCEDEFVICLHHWVMRSQKSLTQLPKIKLKTLSTHALYFSLSFLHTCNSPGWLVITGLTRETWTSSSSSSPIWFLHFSHLVFVFGQEFIHWRVQISLTGFSDFINWLLTNFAVRVCHLERLKGFIAVCRLERKSHEQSTHGRNTHITNTRGSHRINTSTVSVTQNKLPTITPRIRASDIRASFALPTIRLCAKHNNQKLYVQHAHNLQYDLKLI